ncbi:GATOR complex protein NPRL3-like isoform X2 [Amphibalanus amphitrite]|uniref:GATOR complex protein NPRL3-like isoform X2 n=1 Tax=Amphibalanus amphitrite TaxID=1232801 RepID=UPI001C91AC41|nr:GATOR complex protein NPRL3-like isoform X2 [Amphibalanus amphitrite]XP_043230880.1 GATOR complex protein NPRL3-like isoform X2 [Amphibalanus amphitrite]
MQRTNQIYHQKLPSEPVCAGCDRRPLCDTDSSFLEHKQPPAGRIHGQGAVEPVRRPVAPGRSEVRGEGERRAVRRTPDLHPGRPPANLQRREQVHNPPVPHRVRALGQGEPLRGELLPRPESARRHRRLPRGEAVPLHHQTGQKDARWAALPIAVHDDHASSQHDSPRESPFAQVLATSQLARELKAVYDGLVQTGTVHLSIGGWIDVSFCLPQKIHKLHLEERTVEPEDIYRCVRLLQPFHTLLLLEEQRQLVASLSPDSSPTLRRLVRVANPVRSLQHLAADADLTLRHVFELTSQLVYWAKATIIYPLCEKNIYVISPHAPTKLNSKLASDFAEEFGQNLHQVLSEYSMPSTLSQKVTPFSAHHQLPTKVQVLVWLLQRRLLMQLHCYVFFTPTMRLPSGGPAPGSRQSTPDSLSAAANTASDTSSVADGAPPVSAPSLDQLAEAPLASLTDPEREAVLKVPAAKDPDKLRLFTRLLQYFNGMHHLEEIMYRENLRRWQIHQVLEEFGDVLTTCQRCDEMSVHHDSRCD